MINSVVIAILNRVLLTNPAISAELQLLATKVICLELPLLSLSFQITPAGLLVSTRTAPDCQITIPMATAAYLLHHDQLKTFGQLKIVGSVGLARSVLGALAKLEYSHLVYNHNYPSLGIATLKIEDTLKQLLAYLKLVGSNAALSSTSYLQYETPCLCDNLSLEQFYTAVDDLNERTQVLAQRIQRLVTSVALVQGHPAAPDHPVDRVTTV